MQPVSIFGEIEGAAWGGRTLEVIWLFNSSQEPKRHKYGRLYVSALFLGMCILLLPHEGGI